MYRYIRKIRVQDTDATGVLYFANLLQIGLEAFEEFMDQNGHKIGDVIQEKKFLYPIVHAEGDFFAPIYVSDEIEVTLSFPKKGTTSFTHSSVMTRNGEKVGAVSIVHVAYSNEEGKSIPLPEKLEKLIASCV